MAASYFVRTSIASDNFSMISVLFCKNVYCLLQMQHASIFDLSERRPPVTSSLVIVI